MADLPRGRLSLDDIVHMYAWHGRHQMAHITITLDASKGRRKGV